MQKALYLTLFTAIVLIHSQCKKHKSSPPQDDLLPAITQEGKMTMGCLLNGKVLIPKGYVGVSNLRVSYDPSSGNGSLSISMYNINKKDNIEHSLIIGAKNLDQTGTYPITTPIENVGVIYTKAFIDTNTGCYYHWDEDDVRQSGYLTITRLDLTTGVISGTFEALMTKNGCDTISLKDGRFDLTIPH